MKSTVLGDAAELYAFCYVKRKFKAKAASGFTTGIIVSFLGSEVNVFSKSTKKAIVEIVSKQKEKGISAIK